MSHSARFGHRSTLGKLSLRATIPIALVAPIGNMLGQPEVRQSHVVRRASQPEIRA